jgi:hypothetical protein
VELLSEEVQQWARGLDEGELKGRFSGPGGGPCHRVVKPGRRPMLGWLPSGSW